MIDTIKTAVICFIIHYPQYRDNTLRKPDEKAEQLPAVGPGQVRGIMQPAILIICNAPLYSAGQARRR